MRYNCLVRNSRYTPSEPGKAQCVLYYDGDCGFCTRGVGGLRALDRGKAVQWVPFQSLDEPPGGLTWDDLNLAAYLDCGGGPPKEGFYAFRQLTLKIPLLLPLAPLLWFPGVHIPGTTLYRWIARNRYRLSRCRFPGTGPRRGPPGSG